MNLVSLQNWVRNRDSGIFFAPNSVGIMYYYILNQNWDAFNANQNTMWPNILR